MTAISPKLQAILDRVRAAASTQQAIADSSNNPFISLDPEQKRAITLALSGQSFVLVGAAGTGKTTTVQEIVRCLIAEGRVPLLTESSKTLLEGNYGVAGCAFTRRARNNLAKKMPAQMSCSTFHGLLEYAPEFFDSYDEHGRPKVSMRFVPTRNAERPITPELTVLILEESSMLSEELHAVLLQAIKHDVQFIYLGDLNQLPPVMGHAILGFKLLELPVVELTKVHRQKDGEILDFAWDILAGKVFAESDFALPAYKNERLTINRFTKPVRNKDVAAMTYGTVLQGFIHRGEVNPLSTDMILVPYNEGVGQLELNNYVADYYDQVLQRQLFHIIAGFTSKWYAIGDKILVDRQEAIIVNIRINPLYYGKMPQPASSRISRWGGLRSSKYGELLANDEPTSNEDIDAMLHAVNESTSVIDKTNAASHIIEYQFLDSGATIDPAKASDILVADGQLSSAGAVNATMLGYVSTVHKAQGLQGSHVVLFLHGSHNNMLFRELLYTACTRAQHRLTIFTDVGLIQKCIATPRIIGNTLTDKIEFFNQRNKERQA